MIFFSLYLNYTIKSKIGLTYESLLDHVPATVDELT